MKITLLARLFQRLADAFGGGSRPNVIDPVYDEPAAPVPDGRLTDANFSTKMAQFDTRARQAAGAAVAGNVQLIGLDDIKRHFGETWPSIRDAAHKAAEDIIRSHLTALDMFAPIKDESYILLFGELDRAGAEAKAKQIAAEITRRLCGEVEGGALVTVRKLVLEVERPKDGFKSIAEVHASFERAETKAAAQARQESARIGTGIQFGYWPTLNLSKRLIAIYDCNIMRRADVGYMLVGDDAYPPDATGEVAAALDVVALDAAHQGLKQIEQQGKRAVLLLPVHYETLAFRSFRDRYMQGVRAFPESAQRNLAFHVLGLPDGLPQTRLVEVVSRFRPWVLGFICRLPLERPEIERFVGSGLIAISTDAGGTATPPKAVFDQMRAFAATAREAKLRCMFVNARTVSLASAAVRAGFDFVNGDAIVRMVARPGRVYQLEPASGEPTSGAKSPSAKPTPTP
ncbi:MAG: hypothetical protein FJX52_11995 [Alphaproteobacteria bacterium]|nr:hypothetical protein [Alphaproteobacteria bacterium]